MARYVALLWGINLGAKNRLGMPQLRESLHAAGYADVRTHLQSGNLVLTSRRHPDELATGLHDLIADDFDLDVPVVLRSRDELANMLTQQRLGVTVTARNWNTLATLLDMADG